MSAQPREALRRAVHLAQVHVPSVDERLVTLVAPTSFAASKYRGLSNLLRKDHPQLRVIGVTSPGLGDGKTTTAANLAGALAGDGDAPVLLVGGDLRRPALSRLFGLEGRPGLSDWIRDPGLPLDQVVVSHPAVDLSILPAGRCPDDPYRALQAMQANGAWAVLRERYQTLIVDLPPLLAVPDCALIAPALDGVLLVVAAHRTPRELLEEALNALDPHKVAGVVFNRDDQGSRYYRNYGVYYADSPNHDNR